MSDGDAHAGQTHSPPNNPGSIVVPGGGGAAVPSSGGGAGAPVVRGGEASPPRAPAHDTDLPGVQLWPSQFDEVRALSGIFAKMCPEAGAAGAARGAEAAEAAEALAGRIFASRRERWRRSRRPGPLSTQQPRQRRRTRRRRRSGTFLQGRCGCSRRSRRRGVSAARSRARHGPARGPPSAASVRRGARAVGNLRRDVPRGGLPPL